MKTLGRRPCEDGGRDLNDASVGQRNTKDFWQHHQLGERHEVHSLSEPSEETNAANIILFKFYLFIICYCSGSLLLPVGLLQLQLAGATLQLQCIGVSLQRLLLLQNTGFRACRPRSL